MGACKTHGGIPSPLHSLAMLGVPPGLSSRCCQAQHDLQATLLLLQPLNCPAATAKPNMPLGVSESHCCIQHSPQALRNPPPSPAQLPDCFVTAAAPGLYGSHHSMQSLGSLAAAIWCSSQAPSLLPQSPGFLAATAWHALGLLHHHCHQAHHSFQAPAH